MNSIDEDAFVVRARPAKTIDKSRLRSTAQSSGDSSQRRKYKKIRGFEDEMLEIKADVTSSRRVENERIKGASKSKKNRDSRREKSRRYKKNKGVVLIGITFGVCVVLYALYAYVSFKRMQY